MPGLSIVAEQQPSGGLIADRRLYLSADRERLLEEGDVRAAYLLAGERGSIPPAEAARLGLSVVNGRIVQGPPPEMKQMPAPENKMREPEADKGARKRKG